jgi:hypothetical protein
LSRNGGTNRSLGNREEIVCRRAKIPTTPLSALQRYTLPPSKTHQRPTLVLRFSSLRGFINFAAVRPSFFPLIFAPRN